MSQAFRLFLIALLLIFLTTACAPAPKEAAPEDAPAASDVEAAPAEAEPEYPAPDFRLAVLDEFGELGPPDFAGKIVIIDFWATWCGPCRLQAEFLETLRAQVSEDDVQFLALNVGEDEETVRSFVVDHPFPYPLLLDPMDTLSGKYDIIGLPAVMIVDREGEVAWLRNGLSDVDALSAGLAKAGLELPATEEAPAEETVSSAS